ncbi:hypothetical protein ACI2OX_10375 [Bacillus sp. N9]
MSREQIRLLSPFARTIVLFTNNEKQFMEMLQYTLQNKAVDTMVFRNEHGEPVELGAYGVVQDTPIWKNIKKCIFIDDAKGETFIVSAPSNLTQFSEAIAGMRETPNDLYESLIPEDVDPVVTELNGEATVSFKEAIALDEGDSMKKSVWLKGFY